MKSFSCFLDAKFMPTVVRIADQMIAVSESRERDLLFEVPEEKDKVKVIYEANSLDFADFLKKFDKVDREQIDVMSYVDLYKSLLVKGNSND